MATVDITDVRPNVRPNGNSFAEGRLNPPAELWAPPLAPNGTTAAGHVLLREDTFRPVIGGEDPFQPSEPSNPIRNVWIPPKADCRHCNHCGIGLSWAHVLLPGLASGESTRRNRGILCQQPCNRLSHLLQQEWNRHPRLRCSRLLLWPEPSRGASGVVPSPDVPASLTGRGFAPSCSRSVTPQLPPRRRTRIPSFCSVPA